MKVRLCVLTVLTLGCLQSFGQGAQADQIKRRARNLAEQNNARQGAPPSATPQPAAPAPAVAPAATPQQLTPQQKSVAGIRGELALLTKTIDERSRRRMRDDTSQARRGEGHPDASRIPVVGGLEVNGEKCADAVSHVSEKERQKIQRT